MAQCNHLMQFILQCCRWPVIVNTQISLSRTNNQSRTHQKGKKKKSIPLLLYRKYHSGRGGEGGRRINEGLLGGGEGGHSDSSY